MDLFKLINKYGDKKWGNVILSGTYCKIDDDNCEHGINHGYCHIMAYSDKDAEYFEEYPVDVEDKGLIFYLPHSCDEWVIGNIKDAETMVDNLNKAIKYAKENYQ